jgi:hypothetical protein
MIRRSVLGFVCLLALLDVGPATAQPPARAANTPWKAHELMALLNDIIDMKDFQAPMSLKEALGLIQDKVNAKYREEDALPILVDVKAFKAQDPAAPDVYDTQVKFPSFPRKMSIAGALEFALGEIPGRPATYLLRQGMVVVTTLQAASPKQLLRQRVMANFKQYPLHDAMDVLSEMTGLSVVVDPRGDKSKTLVTVRFSNVTLEGALRLLTDMADLKLVVLDDAVYVTSPANARRLLKERRKVNEHAPQTAEKPAPPEG